MGGKGRGEEKKRGRVLAGSAPRCHGECAEWNNAHVTAAIRSFFSFRSKGLIGAARSAVGTNNGGRAKRAARGQRERRLKNGHVGPPALPAHSPPPACWINFGTDAWLRLCQTSGVVEKPCWQTGQTSFYSYRFLEMYLFNLHANYFPSVAGPQRT